MTESPRTIDADHVALLVMDFQPGIIGRLPEGDDLVLRVRGAIDTTRSRGAQIGYVRVAFADADYDAVPDTNRSFAAIAAGRIMHAGAPETAVDDRLAPEAGDIVVRKTRVGAFSTTDLDEQLRAQGINTLILAGISTSGVVLSTVRDAADRDYGLIVLENGCADFDAEVHDLLTTKVFPRQADVISIAEMSDLLRSSPS